MIRVKPGERVKVYNDEGPWKHSRIATVRFGEAIGVNDQGQILLHERPDFKGLSPGQFQHFRTEREVVFLNPAHSNPVRKTQTVSV
jgi:hypothetical protein